MQNIRLVKRAELKQQEESALKKKVAPEAPETKTPVEIVKAWVKEHKDEQNTNARQMFDALFAQ